MQYAFVAFIGLVLGFVAGCLLEPLFWPMFLLITGILVVEASFPWVAICCCSPCWRPLWYALPQ